MHPIPQPAKQVLKSRGITARAVAEKLNYSEQYVGRILNGFGNPSPRFRSDLVALLGCDEDQLFRSTEGDEIQAYVARLVASAPPLTPQLRERLRAILGTDRAAS